MPLLTKRKRTVGRRPKSALPSLDSRAAILAAALHVFARKGVDGTTMREVAKSAKVNNAMIYYHFGDKETLYRAVLSDSFEALDHIWTHPVFAGDALAREKIQKYIEGFIRFEHGNDDLRRIMSMEHASCGENCKWLADKYFHGHYEKLVAILKDGMRSGELKKCDPTFAISSLIGIVVHNFISQPIAEYVVGKKIDLSVARFGKFVTELYFDGLAAKKSSRKQ